MATNHKVCIIMLGESEVGKTSLLLRFCKNFFKDGQRTTTGVDRYTKTIILNNTKIELELWDTVGQEKFRTIIKSYFRKAEGVLLVYDMARHATFMAISSWLRELRELNEEAIVLIVGNKSDLRHLNDASATTVEHFSRDEELEFCEASAKNNENVDEVFQKLALKVLERKNLAPSFNEIPNNKNEVKASSNTVSTSMQTDERKNLAPFLNEISNSKNKVKASSNTVSTSMQTDGDIVHLSADLESNTKKKKKGCC